MANEAFRFITRLHATDQLPPVANRGSSSTQEHAVSTGITFVALAMAEVAFRSPEWITYIETTALLGGTGLYGNPEAYEREFPQVRVGMELPRLTPGYDVPHVLKLTGRHNHGMTAVALEATEVENGNYRVRLHSLHVREGTAFLVITDLDGSLRGWNLGRTKPTELTELTDIILGRAATETRKEVLDGALPTQEFPMFRTQLAEDLVALAQMIAFYAKVPFNFGHKPPQRSRRSG